MYTHTHTHPSPHSDCPDARITPAHTSASLPQPHLQRSLQGAAPLPSLELTSSQHPGCDPTCLLQDLGHRTEGVSPSQCRACPPSSQDAQLKLTVGTGCLSPPAEASSTKAEPGGRTGPASCWGVGGWRQRGSWGGGGDDRQETTPFSLRQGLNLPNS